MFLQVFQYGQASFIGGMRMIVDDAMLKIVIVPIHSDGRAGRRNNSHGLTRISTGLSVPIRVNQWPNLSGSRLAFFMRFT
jgi:hypothetical protein